MGTDFNVIYKRFYSKITDDMYMELDKTETDSLLEELLINAIPWFEFPRVDLNNYNLSKQRFNITLTNEEINVLTAYMIVGWLDQQLANIEVVRMKYSGSDFKFTSQANHIAKLTALRKEYERIGFHFQRLYKRRKTTKNGIVKSTLGSIMASSVRGGNVPTVDTSRPTVDSGSSGGSDEWEDMGDWPPISGGGSSGGGGDSDSWGEMEDLIPEPGDSDSWGEMEDLPFGDLEDNWGSM